MLTAPGMSTGQVGDDIAVATENCDNINNNSCQKFDCNNDGNYDDPGGWLEQAADSHYPRVVNLFIVPYQSSKGLTGAGDTIPILGFASFFVTNWTGANNNQNDPCPDTTWDNDNNPPPRRSPCRRRPRARSRASSSRPWTTSPARSTRTRPAWKVS